MTTRTTKVTRKGQVTIPAAIRDALDIHEGDILVVDQVDNRVVLQRARDIVDWTAGALAEYARGIPDPAKEREQFGQDLADEVYEKYRKL
jgi:AbrB family looped-hinge helix DNA binding protein